MRYARISADSHIDMPWMPNDLFTLNASAALKDRMPYVADGPDGPYWTCKNGMSFGLVCGVGPGGAKYVPGQNYRVEKMHAAGLYDDAKAGKRRVIDPHLRVKDQDLDGVDAEVLFGILGAATRLNDHEAAKEMFCIYNDWVACSGWRACRTATSRRRSRRPIASRSAAASPVSSSRAHGTWSPCTTPSGNRCGRP